MGFLLAEPYSFLPTLQEASCLRLPEALNRNTVERFFAKLKQFRAVATRFDKRQLIRQGTIDVASIRI